MGAKTWMLAYVDGSAGDCLAGRPEPDPAAAEALARRLFPEASLRALGAGALSHACPPGKELMVGVYPGVSLVAASEFALDRPSRLPQRFVDEAGGRTVLLHAMHSVVDWFACAVWREGRLVRALSLSPDSGVIEDIGERLDFERPYWEGRHPVGEPGDAGRYPLPFHPLELGEATLQAWFGYQLEGWGEDDAVDPETIALQRYGRSRSWWRRWRH